MLDLDNDEQILCVWNIETTLKQKNFRLHECDTQVLTNVCDVKKTFLPHFMGGVQPMKKLGYAAISFHRCHL